MTWIAAPHSSAENSARRTARGFSNLSLRAKRIRRAPIRRAIESELEVIQKQLARLPTRLELAGTALGIIFATMMLTTRSCWSFCASGI